VVWAAPEVPRAVCGGQRWCGQPRATGGSIPTPGNCKLVASSGGGLPVGRIARLGPVAGGVTGSIESQPGGERTDGELLSTGQPVTGGVAGARNEQANFSLITAIRDSSLEAIQIPSGTAIQTGSTCNCAYCTWRCSMITGPSFTSRPAGWPILTCLAPRRKSAIDYAQENGLTGSRGIESAAGNHSGNQALPYSSGHRSIAAPQRL
jgi:hypothetical protein